MKASLGWFSALPVCALLVTLPTLVYAAPDEGALLKSFEEEGKFLGSVESAKGIITGKIRAEVEDGLTQARKKIGSSAESAKNDLKLLLENVERAVDLEADIRAQLRDQIESALKQASYPRNRRVGKACQQRRSPSSRPRTTAIGRGNESQRRQAQTAHGSL